MQLSGLDLFLWVAGFVEHLLLLAVLLFRRRASRFPCFTALIAGNALRTIVLFFVYRLGSEDAYFYVYWILAVVDAFLQLAVLYEVTSQVLRPLGTWAPGVRHDYKLVLAASLAVGAALTWLAAPPTHTLQQTVVLKLDFFSSVLMGELFVGTLALSATSGLPWKAHVARISQGLGVYSIAGILIECAHNYFGVAGGTDTYHALSQARISIYAVCVLYWLVTLWKAEPEPEQLPSSLRQRLRQIDDQARQDLRGLKGLDR